MSSALAKLNARTKRLPGYSYKLEEDRGFAFDVVSPKTLEFDEGHMAIKIPYADGNNRDGVGDLLEVGGIDLSRHKKNPICGFDHFKKVDLPIGMAEDPKTGEYTSLIDEVAKTAHDWCFMYQGKGSTLAGQNLGDKTYDHGLFCEQLFDMVVKGLVRSGSLGYQVIEARELPPDYAKGLPDGYHLIKTRKLESSAVVLPANQDTVAKMLFGNKKLCGKPISYFLIKALQPFAPKRKVQLGYEPRKSLDKQGGELPVVSRQALAVVDFVTFAKNVKGANCSNCEHNLNGVCQFSRIKGQPVTHKNCCSAWNAPGTLRDWRGGRSLADYQKKYISHSGGEYVVHAESGRVLGRHPTKEKAEAQLRAVEANKHKRLGKASVKDIRRKYTKAKRLRRRLRKSRPGSSLVHVDEKDVHALEEEARGKGVTCHRLGAKNGLEKVKLTGDDSQIDHIAQKFGQRVKNLEGSMKELQRKVKAAPLDPADPANRPPTNPPGGAAKGPETPKVDEDSDMAGDMIEEEEEEKYSLQILRRMHEDATTLLEQYDDLHGPLEHEGVKMHLEKKLQALVEELEEIEAIALKHHPEEIKAKPFDAGLDTEPELEEEPGEPQDFTEEEPEEPEENVGEEVAEEEEEANEPKGEEEGAAPKKKKKAPTGEEALEGMETKDLKKRLIKALRKHYHKSLDEEEKAHKKKDEEEEEEHHKALEEEEKGLDEYDHHHLHEAHEFLKSLAEKTSLEDEDRMEAYHHHKMLDGMAGGESIEGEEKGMDGEDGKHEAIKNAADYLKKICHEKNFGERHRSEAEEHVKALEPHMEHGGDPDMLEDEEHHEEEGEEGEHEDVVGELDEKEFKHEDDNEFVPLKGKVNLKAGKQAPGENSLKKSLKDQAVKQQKELASLSKQVRELTKKLAGTR